MATKLILPNTIITIKEGAFKYGDLKEIDFPTSLQSIGVEAFYRNKLTNISLPSSLNSV